jgi:hypothetical protein
MATSAGSEVTQALQSLVLEGHEDTHPKIPNPRKFPLPRPGHLILRGRIFKEVQIFCCDRVCVFLTALPARVKRPSRSKKDL